MRAASLYRKKSIGLAFNDHSIRFIEIESPLFPVIRRCGEKFIQEGVIFHGQIKNYQMFSMLLDECFVDWGLKKCPVRILLPETSDSRSESEMLQDRMPLQKNKYAVEVLSLLQKAGFKPFSIETPPNSIGRLCRYIFEQEKVTRLIINFDLSCVTVYIQGGLHSMKLQRKHFNFDFTWRVRLGRTGEQELTPIQKEISSDIQYQNIYKEINGLIVEHNSLKEEDEITEMLLIGDHPDLEKIHDEMIGFFSIPVDSLEYIAKAKGCYSFPRSLYLACGTAMGDIQHFPLLLRPKKIFSF
ncbi:type IV pilus biogenesis protein PilM [Bacillus massilinigeriensis]|uniref:hypothetical protein n=1 Tax=Bacillus mediterraneensis TaxID=1805474 RepID=UPI0008F93C37|nr:hypothetical protein [Bacillus mediterraneensis]